MAKLTSNLSQNTVAPSSPLSSPPATPTKPSRSPDEQPDLPSPSPPTSPKAASQAFQAPEATPVTPQRKHNHKPSVDDTPMGPSSHGTDEGYEKVEKQRPFIEAELKRHIHDGGQQFADSAFHRDVSQDSITKVVNDANLYCKNRWVEIPEAVGKESELYAPYLNIFEGVLKHGNLKRTRSVLASYGIKASHEEGIDNTELKSSPDFMFQGHHSAAFPPSDTDFVPDNNGKKWAFKFCASLVDIKTEKSGLESSENFLDHLVQLAVYARQCFIQQQNRFFVYALILTEQRVRLYQFDRSGVQYSALIHIHDNPKDFARILLGICSSNAEKVGFDPKVKWERKCRCLYTLDENNRSIRYELTSVKPVFWRRAIRGRGTQCHAVIGPDGEKRLIKEAWRSRDRTPEWEFLKEAKGLAGVGQMVAYEETAFTTAKHRGIDISSFVDEPNPTFHDRIFSRTTLQAYGDPIDKFETRLQLLYAFRDAIAGHQNLWRKGILHRDISINNILLGKADAEPGNRGLVIDLDMAIWINRTTSLAGADFRTGTRVFQSVMVLRSGAYGVSALPHDYLDDLESFFYVLFWICFTFEMTGPKPEFLNYWESQDARSAAQAKFEFLFNPLDDIPGCRLSPFFGEIFFTLFENLRQFFESQFKRKRSLVKAPRKALEALMPQSEEHYAEIFSHIDTAIAAIEVLPGEKTNRRPRLSKAPRHGKRPSTGSPDDSPDPKRKKTGLQKKAAADNENPFAPTIPSKLSLETTFE